MVVNIDFLSRKFRPQEDHQPQAPANVRYATIKTPSGNASDQVIAGQLIHF